MQKKTYYECLKIIKEANTLQELEKIEKKLPNSPSLKALVAEKKKEFKKEDRY